MTERIEPATDASGLFLPLRIGSLSLRNRFVMAPMTRCFSSGGVPGPDVAAYYRRRAENEVGLLITEGTWIPHAGAANDENVPRLYGEDALAGWSRVVAEVHAAGGKIMPQLWHVGLFEKPAIENVYASGAAVEDRQVGPSGMAGGLGVLPYRHCEPMSTAEIDAVIEAYAAAARSAHRIGFDGVALHGAHGYLIDQFLWSATNLREDAFGGDLARRARFVADVVAEIRRRTAPDFPIMLRISQWKVHDYGATIAADPAELERLLRPIVDAGVDVVDCSQRRYWEPSFPGSDLNLAGWVKKVTGALTMTVGSVGLDQELFATFFGEQARPQSLDRLLRMYENGDFDLVAIGRALIADPGWVRKVRSNASSFETYTPKALETLL